MADVVSGCLIGFTGWCIGKWASASDIDLLLAATEMIMSMKYWEGFLTVEP
jgi:hypothetical protein